MIRFRSPAECRLQKVVERDVGLERVGLAFDRQNLRLLDVKLGGIFADYDAILFRNEVSQNPQECGLAGTSSTTDEQRLSACEFAELRNPPEVASMFRER
jgi:hypothetical protein